MATTRRSMQHKRWILGALAALWIMPAVAQTRSDDADDAGRWPFSGRSRYDKLPDAETSGKGPSTAQGQATSRGEPGDDSATDLTMVTTTSGSAAQPPAGD